MSDSGEHSTAAKAARRMNSGRVMPASFAARPIASASSEQSLTAIVVATSPTTDNSVA